MPPTDQELRQRKTLIICQQYAEGRQPYRQSMKELTRMGLSDQLADHLLAEALHGQQEQSLRDVGEHPGQLPGEADAELPEPDSETQDPKSES